VKIVKSYKPFTVFTKTLHRRSLMGGSYASVDTNLDLYSTSNDTMQLICISILHENYI